MRISASMIKAGCAAITVFYCAAFAASGIAVSVKCPLRNKTEGDMFGHINRTDIVNNRSVKDTIMYSAENGFARLPCISQDGKKVCFYRDGDKWVNSQLAEGTPDYVSVVDIDGQNLMNLVTFDGALAVNRYDYTQGGSDRYIDWPAGDWIYYQKPTTTEIWRVNVTSSENELVTTWTNGNGVPFLGRFNMSAGGDRACHGGQMCEFPAMTGCATDQCFGCNHTMSASGRFLNGWLINTGTLLWPASYRAVGDGTAPSPYDMTPYNGRLIMYGGHSYFDFLDWNWDTGIRTNFGVYTSDCICYRHVSYMIGTQYLQETIGSPMVGDASEFPRWSCNSDKWILHSPGQQQVLYNWVDREAVLGGRNEVGANGANDAGDFWIEPPEPSYAGTRYEDIAGEWLLLGTKSTAPLPGYVRGPDCANPFEIALKFGDLVIMPQSVYDTIAKGLPVTAEHPMAARYAVVIPSFHTIVVQANSSIEVTVTNQNYDPIDPIFGKPPAPPEWRIIGPGASISPSSGTSATITTTGSFDACSVEVSMTVGSITKAVKKLVATEAAPIARQPLSINATSRAQSMRITQSARGAVSISLPHADAGSVDIYAASGKRTFRVPCIAGQATIAEGLLAPGMHIFRAHVPGKSRCVSRYMVD